MPGGSILAYGPGGEGGGGGEEGGGGGSLCEHSRVRFQRGEDFRFQISKRSRPVWDVHCRYQIFKNFSAARAPWRWRVRFLSFTFQKAQFRSHTRRNIGRVCPGRNPKKTRLDPKEKPAITTKAVL